jgi:hypothetical protein
MIRPLSQGRLENADRVKMTARYHFTAAGRPSKTFRVR